MMVGTERRRCLTPFPLQVVVAVLLLTGAKAALAGPQIMVQFSEAGCKGSCPAPTTFTDGGTGVLAFPLNLSFGDFKLNGGQTEGFMFANAATPNEPNADILDPGGNILIRQLSSGMLTIKLTETGLVAQDVSAIGLYFDPALTLAPGSTMTVRTYADASDTPFGLATLMPLQGIAANGVTFTNNADGGVTFTNTDATHQKSGEANTASFLPLVLSPYGDFSITESVTVSGPVSAVQARLSGSFTADPPVYAPEPASVSAFGFGVFVLAICRRRRLRHGRGRIPSFPS